MNLEKKIAFFNKDMNPSPLTKEIDGLWITKSVPYRVIKVWKTDNERPRLSEELPEIQAYSAFMARQLYTFKVH